jgi:hypothetical protein
MGTPADFWIVLAAIAAWSAVLVVIALFADRAAKFPGLNSSGLNSSGLNSSGLNSSGLNSRARSSPIPD